jgi:hypothetical protein
MPANTAKNYPYPLGTDRLMDGDNAIAALAAAVDTKSGVACSGQATTATPGGLNQYAAVAITFPVGLFTVAPIVMVTNYGGGTTLTLGACSTANPTTTGTVIYGSRVAGGVNPVTLNWLAIQVP